MPRDLTGTGRYPPETWFHPFSFYSCVRLGDPEQLHFIMETDPFFLTQDNGAGAPIHFAVTYKQLDMVHHILRQVPEAVNQRDGYGFTPLHRAAHLAEHDGYLEIYEYLLSEGADPRIRTNDYDPYLDPGRKVPEEVAVDDDGVRGEIRELNAKYEATPKQSRPHPDLSDWWTLYDHGLDDVRNWPFDFKPVYPEEKKRERDKQRRKEERAARRDLRMQRLGLSDYQQAAENGQADGSAKDGGEHTAKMGVAILFPGQGSQYVGMLSNAKHLEPVQEMLAKAKEILGYDLLRMCEEGPKEELDDTKVAQPALLVAGLAAVEVLRSESPEKVQHAQATAGLSLGEYTAMVFSGAISFEDGLKVVKERAKAMAEAGREGRQGMLTVVGLSEDDLEALCQESRDEHDGVCKVANYLFPAGMVVSGDEELIEDVQKKAVERGARKVQRVAVTGAFHTERMEPAQEHLQKHLIRVSDPAIPVYSNVTAAPLHTGEEAKDLLRRQLVEPVRWEESVRNMIKDGAGELWELGPGQQLKAMTKRIDVEAWNKFRNVAL